MRAGQRALAQAGRAGLPILNLISSATSSMGTLAGSHPAFGLRPSDGWLVDFLGEMKVNWESLNRLAFVQLTGGNVGSTALPVLGGYGGGPAGTALLMTAYYLAGVVLFQGSYHLTGPVHFRYGCSTTPDCLWVFAVVGRAHQPEHALSGDRARVYGRRAGHAHVLPGGGCLDACRRPLRIRRGPTAHPARAVIEDGITPLEAQACIEFASAATRLTSGQANAVVQRLLEKYAVQIKPRRPGCAFRNAMTWWRAARRRTICGCTTRPGKNWCSLGCRYKGFKSAADKPGCNGTCFARALDERGGF